MSIYCLLLPSIGFYWLLLPSIAFYYFLLFAEIQVVTDLKLLAIILGLHSNSCMHNCPYGFCYKVDERGRKNGNRGRYTTSSELRTLLSCIFWFNRWMEAGGNPNNLKHFMSQARLPLKIFREEDYSKAILLLNPPMILHLLIGNYESFRVIYSHSVSFRVIQSHLESFREVFRVIQSDSE